MWVSSSPILGRKEKGIVDFLPMCSYFHGLFSLFIQSKPLKSVSVIIV